MDFVLLGNVAIILWGVYHICIGIVKAYKNRNRLGSLNDDEEIMRFENLRDSKTGRVLEVKTKKLTKEDRENHDKIREMAVISAVQIKSLWSDNDE